MAKNKKTKKAALKAPPAKQAPQAAEQEEIVFEKAEPFGSATEEPAMPQEPLETPAAQLRKKDGNSLIKMLAVGAIFIIAMAMAYHFFVLAAQAFAPGTKVDKATFEGILDDAQKVYIVMDVRGLTDAQMSNNVMQCGVDFAASTYLGGKVRIPISLGNEGCVTPAGPTPVADCFSMLADGTTLYIRGGESAPQYYSNGMVVYIGKDYQLGSCSIKLAQ
ncbi:MAG: hypothetical protein AB1295_01210 [Candidatus Micrarchaeota archaeon]